MSPELLTGHQWRATFAGLGLSVGATAVAAVAVAQGGAPLWVSLAVTAVGATAISVIANALLLASRRRVRRIRAALQAIGRGDMSHRIRLEEMGDFSDEARAINQLAEIVGSATQSAARLTEELQRLPETMAAAVAEIEQGADNQEAAVEETASLIANTTNSIRSINGEVETLAQHNDETAASITEMGSAIDHVATAAATLQRSMEASTSAVHQIGAQIRRVAKNADSVQGGAEETAASIAEMDRAIQEVGQHVGSAAELTERVSQSAEGGARAVGATIAGISQIRSLSLDARSALEALDARMGEIGEITTVIDAISDETNLLSLNAAIIAAQAGEHGKAFAVVADQVKTLARRTTTSTKQIDELIQAVQGESKHAVQAMGAGIEAVEEGVARSGLAGEALEAIIESSREASGRVAEIARAAAEQTRNSNHVAGAAQQTSEHIQQISAAMGEQTQAADQLLASATESVELCRQVTAATEEQRETGRYISNNVMSITEMIQSIHHRAAVHERDSSSMSAAVSSILDNARKGTAQIPEVVGVVAELQQQAEAVGAEVARFHGSAAGDEADR